MSRLLKVVAEVELPQFLRFHFERAVKRLLCRGLSPDKPCIDRKLSAASSGVYPSNNVRFPKQWHGVVAEFPFGGWGVCLKSIGPAPEVFESTSIPYQRIKGSQKANNALWLPAYQSASGPEVTNFAHFHTFQRARLQERGNNVGSPLQVRSGIAEMKESGAEAALGYRRQDAGDQQREPPEPLIRVDVFVPGSRPLAEPDR